MRRSRTPVREGRGPEGPRDASPPSDARRKAVSRPGFGVVRSLPFEGDETALVAAMRSGRADAAAALYDRHVRAIHALVFRLMGPDPELDDAVHDVFVRALESLPRLQNPAALRSWLFGIAVRAVAIRFQRRKRQKWLRFMAPEELPEQAVVLDTELGEALRDVYAILNGMDPDERIALVLHRVEGLPLEEAANVADTSLATFRRRLARGEAKFFARAGRRPSLLGWLNAGDEP
jgi:RNA polymerase sigma-70 factor, ECF subfamily